LDISALFFGESFGSVLVHDRVFIGEVVEPAVVFGGQPDFRVNLLETV